MIRHIVMWNFKNEFSQRENKANAERVKRELEALPEHIKEIVELLKLASH